MIAKQCLCDAETGWKLAIEQRTRGNDRLSNCDIGLSTRGGGTVPCLGRICGEGSPFPRDSDYGILCVTSGGLPRNTAGTYALPAVITWLRQFSMKKPRARRSAKPSDTAARIVERIQGIIQEELSIDEAHRENTKSQSASQQVRAKCQ